VASKAIVKAKPLEENTDGELLMLADAGNQKANTLLFARWDKAGMTDGMIEGMVEIQDRVLTIAHTSLFTKELYERKMNKLRAELGYKSGSALERLLIDRIVMCWYNLSNAEANYAAKTRDGVSLEVGTYLQKSVDRSEARYQAAIKSLAVVRRLQLPALQVNIGEKQINILQGVGVQTNAIPASSD